MSADGGLEAGLQWAQRLGRISRVLGVSGRRLVESAEGWVVLASMDTRRRPVLRLAADEAARLIAEGKVVAARRGGGYVAAPPTTTNVETEAMAAGPWLLAAAGVSKAKSKGRGFAALALAAFAGNGPLSMRQASAGLKLVEDAEQASRDPGLTMNWDAGAVDKQRRSGGGAPMGPRAAVAAGRRLARVRAAMGEADPAFAIIWAACVQQMSLLALRRRFGLKKGAAGETLGEALEKLAEAYDG